MRFPRPLEPQSVQGRLLVLGAVLAVTTVVAVVVGLYAVATLAPVPKNVLSAAAGLLFGLLEGVLLVWLAALSGALIAFALGRSLGREAVERLTGARMARVDALLGRRGLLAVLGARLLPGLPFTAVNYGAGLTRGYCPGRYRAAARACCNAPASRRGP